MKNKRGLVFTCLHCDEYSDVRERCESHIFKSHVSLVQAPFYCTLCMFRSKSKKTFDNHHKENGYSLHVMRRSLLRQKDQRFNEDEFLKSCKNPYVVTVGKDMTVMTSEESQAFWDAKRAARGKDRSTDAIADAARIAGIEGSNFTTSTPQEQVRSAPIVPAPVKTPQRKRNKSVSEEGSPSPKKTKTDNLEMNAEVNFEVDYDLPKEAGNDDASSISSCNSSCSACSSSPIESGSREQSKWLCRTLSDGFSKIAKSLDEMTAAQNKQASAILELAQVLMARPLDTPRENRRPHGTSSSRPRSSASSSSSAYRGFPHESY